MPDILTFGFLIDLICTIQHCSRLIWLGDLNYRVSLSYEEAATLLEDNDWDSLLQKDQVGSCNFYVNLVLFDCINSLL